MGSISAKKNDKTLLALIWVISVAIPLVVALLLFIPQTGKLGDLDVSFLPHLNAVINSSCAIALMLGLYFIKNGKVETHKTMMMVAFTLGALFLISYVIYHFQGPKTYFGDANGDGIVSDLEKLDIGGKRIVYLVVLLSHILLSAAVVPLVLFAVYYAFTKQIDKHKRIVKYTWPIWFYVAVSGVAVYWMISPYYQF